MQISTAPQGPFETVVPHGTKVAAGLTETRTSGFSDIFSSTGFSAAAEAPDLSAKAAFLKRPLDRQERVALVKDAIAMPTDAESREVKWVFETNPAGVEMPPQASVLPLSMKGTVVQAPRAAGDFRETLPVSGDSTGGDAVIPADDTENIEAVRREDDPENTPPRENVFLFLLSQGHMLRPEQKQAGPHDAITASSITVKDAFSSEVPEGETLERGAPSSGAKPSERRKEIASVAFGTETWRDDRSAETFGRTVASAIAELRDTRPQMQRNEESIGRPAAADRIFPNVENEKGPDGDRPAGAIGTADPDALPPDRADSEPEPDPARAAGEAGRHPREAARATSGSSAILGAQDSDPALSNVDPQANEPHTEPAMGPEDQTSARRESARAAIPAVLDSVRHRPALHRGEGSRPAHSGEPTIGASIPDKAATDTLPQPFSGNLPSPRPAPQAALSQPLWERGPLHRDPAGTEEFQAAAISMTGIQQAIPAAAHLAPGADVARSAIHQISAAFASKQDSPVELALNPEELGHVRMTFKPGDAGISVMIVADRSDTIDLLRRNIDMLAQELRSIGYSGATFHFGQGHSQGQRPPERHLVEHIPVEKNATGPLPEAHRTLRTAVGLDLKL